jgi:hypothetical protein
MEFVSLPWNTPQHNFQEEVNNERRTDNFNCSDDLNRLLFAAVVNRRFRRKLLQTPRKAVVAGYDGYSFDLPPWELDAIYNIRAAFLADFAQQLIARLQQTDSVGIAEAREIGGAKTSPLQMISNLL